MLDEDNSFILISFSFERILTTIRGKFGDELRPG
jgi:hypothetical protein